MAGMDPPLLMTLLALLHLASNAASSLLHTLSSNRTPWHRHQHSTLHALNQRYRLVHRIPPSFNPPAHLPSRLSLLQIRELPQMMHCVQIPNLYEPCTDSLHHFSSCLQSLPPVGFPFQEIAWVQGVGAKFEKTAEGARWCGGPEGELLHQRCLFRSDELFETLVEGGEVGMGGNRVKGGVVALVALVFPDVDYCQRRNVLVNCLPKNGYG